MIIPIPCKFGEKALCNGKRLVFKAVSWYKWFSGMEYTYYFETGNRWNPTSFYVSKGKDFSEYIEVDDQLTSIFDFKEKKFPFRRKGYVDGISYINGKNYACIVSETFYWSHHKVECDKYGYYIPGGNILFQCNWNENQKDGILLKKVKMQEAKHEGDLS